MFTGLVQDIGVVAEVVDRGDDRQLRITSALDLGVLEIGASICCSGCCLTITEKGADWFRVDVSGETLSKTSIGSWEEGHKVNLEPSLRLGDELGGHLVYGHVDGLAVVREITQDGESWRLRIEAPEDLAGYIAPKGSVALDGISLTVNEVEGNVFGVNIIPHTWERTNLGAAAVGAQLNIEIDMLARYVERMMVTQGGK